MNNVAADVKPFDVRLNNVINAWPKSRGWYVAVRRDAQQGDLWMRTRSAATAARMIPYGFKGTVPTEARWSGLRLKDLPIYP